MHVKIAVLIRYSTSKKKKRGRESNAVCKGKYYL